MNSQKKLEGTVHHPKPEDLDVQEAFAVSHDWPGSSIGQGVRNYFPLARFLNAIGSLMIFIAIITGAILAGKLIAEAREKPAHQLRSDTVLPPSKP